jgi:hypothetical protein
MALAKLRVAPAGSAEKCKAIPRPSLLAVALPLQ